METFGNILIAAVMLAAIVLGCISMISFAQNKILIAECEKELPRTESCMLIAVPENSTNEPL